MKTSISCVVAMSTTIDLGPLVDAMAQSNRSADGAAPAGAQELAMIRAQTAQELDASSAREAGVMRAAIEGALPAGAKLVELVMKRSGLVVTSRTTFAIDDLALLPALVLGAPAPGAAPVRPFGAFDVSMAGSAVTLAGTTPADPAGGTSKGTLTFELEPSKAASSHDATRVQGKRLVWEGPLGGPAVSIRASWRSVPPNGIY